MQVGGNAAAPGFQVLEPGPGVLPLVFASEDRGAIGLELARLRKRLGELRAQELGDGVVLFVGNATGEVVPAAGEAREGATGGCRVGRGAVAAGRGITTFVVIDVNAV